MLLDANILVYAVDALAPQHTASHAVVQAALGDGVPGVLVPQVLLEFFAVVTSPRRVRQPLDPVRAWRQVEALRAGLPVLNVQPTALTALGELVSERRTKGPDVFDLFLVAQMRTHGVREICTYNAADFANVPGVEALTAEAALSRYGLAGTP